MRGLHGRYHSKVALTVGCGIGVTTEVVGVYLCVVGSASDGYGSGEVGGSGCVPDRL